MTATGFPAGTRVRVRDDWPETRGPCHIRTPHYLRGMMGTVVRHLGDFPNPELVRGSMRAITEGGYLRDGDTPVGSIDPVRFAGQGVAA